MFQNIFKKSFPIIGVIHLKPLLGEIDSPGITELLQQVEQDVQILEKAGIDGILLENDSDKPHTLTISKVQVAALSVLTKRAVENSKVPIGVTSLLVDWEASFAIAKATGASFIRLNVFVDTVMRDLDTWKTISAECRKMIKIDPLEINAYRKKIKAEGILLLTDVHVKYMTMLEKTKTIATSAKQAEISGADAIIVTGTRTGTPTSITDIIEAKKGLANIPVLIGSGLVKNDISKLLKSANGAIVGTAFKKNGKLNFQKIKDFMNEVNILRRSK